MRGDDTIKRQLEQRQADERRESSGSTPPEDLLDRALKEGAEEKPARPEGESGRE